MVIAQIRAKTYKAGDKLPAERDLAETFCVSRPSVREAMIALEILGIVEICGRSGIYVLDSAPSKLEEEGGKAAVRRDLDVGAFELIEARIVIEGETAGLAAASVKPEDITTLRALLARMNSDDIVEAEEADRAFHVHIASMTDNSALIDAVDHLWVLRIKSPLASQIMVRAQGGGHQARMDEHEAIVRALETGSGIAARRAMRRHLENVRDYLLDATETAELDALRRKLKSRRLAVVGRTRATSSAE